MKIELHYRFKEDNEIREATLNVEADKVYPFTKAVTEAENHIQKMHGSWTLENVVEFHMTLKNE